MSYLSADYLIFLRTSYSDASGVNTGWARWANATGLGTEGGPSPTYNTYTIAHWLFLYSSFDSKFHKNMYIILIPEKILGNTDLILVLYVGIWFIR